MLTQRELRDLQSLSDSEQQEAMRLAPVVARQYSGTDTPADLAIVASRGEWRPARHLLLISQAVTAAISGTGPRVLIVEIPVRHGKSQFLSQYTTAWYLGHNPTNQVVLASATQRLAERWSRRARQVVADYGPAYYGVGLSGSRTSAQDWQTDRGGGLVAAGIGSDIVGVDGNLLVLDDYCRNSRDALSETVRDAQWEWFESTFMRRWEPGGVLIVLCTRWSTDDLIGRAVDLESFPPYRRIRLPAIAEDADDELGRKPGEALWPERWPLGSEKQLVANAWGMQTQGLHMTRASIDEYWWRALYQQDPRAGMMAFWPEEYWRGIFCDSIPTTGIQAACIGVDFAEGKSSGSDYAAVVLAVVAGDKIHVRAELQREPPEATIARAFRMAVEHKCTFVVMEAQNYTTLIAGACEREMAKQEAYGIDVELIRNTAQKHYRIQRLGEYFKRRQITILNTVGGRMLERQLAEFPHARHDDGADALEFSIRFLPDAVRGPTQQMRITV